MQSYSYHWKQPQNCVQWRHTHFRMSLKSPELSAIFYIQLLSSSVPSTDPHFGCKKKEFSHQNIHTAHKHQQTKTFRKEKYVYKRSSTHILSWIVEWTLSMITTCWIPGANHTHTLFETLIHSLDFKQNN